LGILGGTFDPVHNAHLAMAQAAMRSLRLDRMLWIPTGKPDYRKPPVASVSDRLAMLALATKDQPDYEVAPGGDALVVPMAPLAVSASDIRARAARGEPLEGLVPRAVANYIADNRLYR